MLKDKGDSRVDELDRLERKPEVFVSLDRGLEAPNENFVPGPYYADSEEVIPELEEDSSVSSQAPSGEKASVDRRDFLKVFSMGAVAATSACVRRPAERIVPYVNKPIDQVVGEPTHYATTCGLCSAGCGIIARTREGRPTKLEGNPEHPVNKGALCSQGQAQIQGTFHPERLPAPQFRHAFKLNDVTWDSAYEQLAGTLKKTKKIGIFTGGATGHRNEFYKDVLKALGSDPSRLYTYEPNGIHGQIAKAHESVFGTRTLPRMELVKSNFILGIGSDFLEVGTSSVYHSKSFTKGISYNKGRMGRFVQFESHLSLTGGRADERHVIAPRQELLVALLMLRSLYENANSKGSNRSRAVIKKMLDANRGLLADAYTSVGIKREEFDRLANEMLAARAVVVAGGSACFTEDATKLQIVSIFSNILVGAYGSILYLDKGWEIPPYDPEDLNRFLKDAADLDVLFVIESNPVFTLPPSWRLKQKLESIPHVVSIQSFPNEIDLLSEYVLPCHHPLESWGDEQPVAGFWSMRQPVVRPTANSRQAEDILLWLCAHTENSLPYEDYRAYLMKKWERIYKASRTSSKFELFFKVVQRRGFIYNVENRQIGEVRDVSALFVGVTIPTAGPRLISPLDSRFQDGRTAHLPILQEIGEGLSTIAWDSFVAINPNTMKKLGLKRNQMVKLETDVGVLEIAAYPMPGNHPDTFVIYRGNGRQDKRSTITYQNGVNPLVAIAKRVDSLTGSAVSTGEKVTVTPLTSYYRLAAMQKHNDLANRKDIVKTVPLAKVGSLKQIDLDKVPDIFPAIERVEHRWGMTIDLNRCDGCGACMVACGIENNVPTVGREQILLGREMHWIRMDRYFYGDVNNPTVTFQPVMCQHCEHAPCEAVCPVFATTHDPEGLNAMTYNRCVGTRYCANACPYKVRRFNWWTHKWNVMGERQVDRNPRAFNPDVTVRTRGVMEKCSFCVQRLRDGKHKARLEDRSVRDEDVQVACQQTCPSDAIMFGNLNDSASQATHGRKDPRAYLMLGGEPEHEHYGIKTLPGVSYLRKVTHHEQKESKEDGHH